MSDDWLEAERRIEAAWASGSEELDLSWLDIEAVPASVAGLARVRVIRFECCFRLVDLTALAQLPALRQLDLFLCQTLSNLSPLALLSGLQTLNFSGCATLSDLSPLASLPVLQRLSLSESSALSNLSLLASLPALQRLELSGCDTLSDLLPLASLTDLKQLNLRDCIGLSDLSSLASLTTLQILELSGSEALSDLLPLASLTALQQLNLRGCTALSDLSPLASLTTLQRLELSGCNTLCDLLPLASLTALQQLNLSKSKELSDLSPLASLTALQLLNLSGCTALSDLSPLASLTTLQTLYLSQCPALSDLSPLVSLTALQRLNLSGCTALSDLSPLASLTALQLLNLSRCKALSELSPLASLTALHWLALSGCEALSDLSSLASLTALQKLNLSECKALSNLSPLASLAALQQLDLGGCTALSELSPLASLTALQQLNLSRCTELSELSPLVSLTALHRLTLSWCAALSVLSPLASLAALQELNLSECKALSDLSPLASLAALQELNLSECKALSDLSPLASLAALQQLDLSGCTALSDLSPLISLTTLQKLDLSECQVLKDLHHPLDLPDVIELHATLLACHPESSLLKAGMKLKMLYCGSLLVAPNELASQEGYADGDNCLPRLKAWRADLDQGQADNHCIKLFVLGNGSAGKTQICRRLNGQAFDPSIPSTHGIDLGRVNLIPANGDKPAVIAHVWDFGGQDIYHGTHALFMDERALFVIVWNPDLETAQPYAEHGVAMRHRPLAYWLAMVRDVAGKDAAVVVVQSKCDRQQDSVQPPLPAEYGLRYLRYTACSTKNQSGMSSLLTSIQDRAQLLLERYGQVLLPASWVAAGDTLRARCSKGLRTLSRAEFETLCRAHHASAPPEVVLHYLHRSGEVFYRQGLFGDQLILDQQWALDGVYAVLERQRSLPLLHRQEGRFDQEVLDALVWRDKYSSDEQALFISLMEQCGACFPMEHDEEYPKQTPYLAPDLLPERDEVQAHIDCVWREAETHLEVWLNYRFLHDGVMKELLCAIGRRAGVHAVYWRYGVCFFDQGMQATFLLEAQPDINPQQPGAGQLVWQVHVAQAKNIEWVQRWLEDLLQTVTGKAQGQQPEVIWRHQLEQASERDNEAYMDADDSNPIHRLQPGSQPDAKPTVYVSYGWGDANTALLEQLETAFTQHGCQLIYDKRKMRTGDWISTFMREIGQSRHVLVLLDDKYLRSPYCMRELLYLYQSSLGDKAAFCRRIVPCLPEALPLSSVKHRLPYLRHWKEEAKSHQELLDEFSLAELSPETRDEVLLVKDFCHRTDEMLAWIADTLMPRGAHALSDNNFAAIFTALAANGFPVPHPDPGSPG